MAEICQKKVKKMKYPMSELPEKYGITKSVVYSRLEALHIKPTRAGNKSYINDEELQLMDELSAHLKASGGTKDFVEQCIQAGRINPASEGAIVIQSQAQTIASSSQETLNSQSGTTTDAEDVVEHLVTQKDARVTAEDLQETHENSQYRAAAKVMGEETLTLLYEATEAFTLPGLKEQVDRHRSRIKQIRARRTKGIGNDINDFLLNSLPAQMAAGMSGSLPSLNGRKEPAGESSTNGSRNGSSPNEPKDSSGLSLQ